MSTYLVTKAGHCTLYAEISRDGAVVWRVERTKATGSVPRTGAGDRSQVEHGLHLQLAQDTPYHAPRQLWIATGNGQEGALSY